MKRKNACFMIACVFASVFAIAKPEKRPAFLTFAGDTVRSVNLDGNGISILGRATDRWHNIYLTGGFYGSVRFGDSVFTSHGRCDYFLVKLNASGTLLWATAQGSSSGEYGVK